MLLALKIEKGFSADVVMVDNVIDYQELDNKGTYLLTYEDPEKGNGLFDIQIKHVIEIKEVVA